MVPEATRRVEGPLFTNNIDNMQQIQLSENIYYVGVNDRHTDLFENHMELPNGVSYNSYLIVDEKVTLIDTV